jgi:hypothetical protein
MKRNPIAIFVVVVFLVTVGVFSVSYYVNVMLDEVFGDQYRLFQSEQRGMSEQEVVQLLGKPYKVYEASTAPSDYYIEGYSYKRREITNKVYIYIATEPIAYIYLDKENRVEAVFVGGS